ncbi:unnamed protein product, partial [marine sediment metagenome]
MIEMKKTCRECEEEFTPDKFHPHQVYCSKSCKWIWHGKHGKTGQKKLERYHKLRLKALKILGGECAICGINNPHLLNIDHINGKENDDFKKNNIPFLRMIVENPKKAKERYQILCWNHNMLKYQYPEEYKQLQRGGEDLGIPPGS